MSSPSPSPAPKQPDERILVSKGGPLFSWLPPEYCAVARGALIAAIIAVLGVVIQAIQTGAITLPPTYAWVGSLVVMVAQTIIGAIDSHSTGKTTTALAAKERAREAAAQFTNGQPVAPIQASASHPAVIGGMEAVVTVDPRASREPQPAQPPVPPKGRTKAPKAAVKPAPKPKAPKTTAKAKSAKDGAR